MDGADNDRRLRRAALQIAIQLPADTREAIEVLRFADELARFCLVGLRREALQLANQLPSDPSEARKVLHYARQLLTSYLDDSSEKDLEPPTPPRLRLI